MVGGGQGAFIGGVHRIAARMDDHFELVAGALLSDPARAKASSADLGLDPERRYGSFEDIAKPEAARSDGIAAVSIVTPNHMHAGPAIAFPESGIRILCDKPLASTLEDAARIKRAVQTSKAQLVLTHN